MKRRRRVIESKKYERRKRTIKILKLVALGVLMVGIGAVPPPWALGRVLKELAMPDTAKNRRYVRRKLRELKKRDYLRCSGNRYTVSDRGNRMLSETAIWNLAIPKPKVWVQCWYLVFFAIPVERNRARLAFDAVLKNLGFVLYQRSVWVYPYPCRGTVEKVARFYGLSKHISYLTAIALDGQGGLMRHFNLA